MTRECEDIQTKVDLNSPQPGTTFPPGRCSLQQFDELVAKAAKCRSESDLVSAWLLRNRHFDEDDDDDEHALEAAKANSDRARRVANSDQDGKDSDLFFDFDIVPDREEEDDGDGLKGGDYKAAVTRDAATATSEEAEEAAAGMASGAGDVPPAWDQMQLQTGSAERSSPTAVSPSGKPRTESPLVSPDSLLEEPIPDLLLEGDEAVPDTKSGSSSSGDEDESPLTFVKGDCRHTVASSTLSSLVAMLEKESPRSKGRDCGGGTSGATGAWGMGRYRSELPTIAASPAVTSFFPVATDHECDFQQRTASPFGLRADSMPCLPKGREQLKKDAPKEEQERSEKVEPERQRCERKAKMRRASSLKAAKPPGSPSAGRKLSVR